MTKHNKSIKDGFQNKGEQKTQPEQSLNHLTKTYNFFSEKNINSIFQLQTLELLDIFQEHIVYQDKQHTILFANKAASESVGMKPENLIGQKCYTIWQNQDFPCSNCPIQQALETGKPVDGEQYSPDGRFWFIRGYPVFNSQGEIISAIEVTSDITERKVIQNKLKKSEATTRSLLNAITESALLIDRQGNILVANDKVAKRLAKCKAEIIIGCSIFDFFDYETAQIEKFRYDQVFNTGQPLRVESQISERDFDIHYYPIRSWKGNITQLAIFAIDITDRKKAEVNLQNKIEEFELLLDNIDNQIWYISSPDTYRRANQARARFLGKTKEELQNKSLFDLMLKQDAQICIQTNQKIFRNKKQICIEQQAHDPNGCPRLLSITKTPKLDSQGQVEYVICTAQDITERKKAEDALKRSEARLNRSQQVARVATWEKDFQTGDWYWSDEQYRLFGYQPGQIKNKREILKKHIHPNDLTRSKKLLEQAKAGKRPFDIKFRYTTIQGQEHFGHCLGEMEWDEHRRPIRIYGLMKDVTDQVKMEEALEKSQEKYRTLLQSTSTKNLNKFQNIVGKSKKMRNIYNLIQQLAHVDTSVLITGESGTGKELIVEALHYSGARSDGPLIKVNCSALSEQLLESELFGHVRGAFTGAVRDKIGRIQAAENGTLFLDEIGELSSSIQIKLLRFLEKKEFERVGDSRTFKANVRILAATNVDLYSKVRAQEFREDLFFRLKIIPIHIPPLRERLEDIPLLIDHFLQIFQRQLQKPITGLSHKAFQLCLQYCWPGNVRELKSAMEHACLLCPEDQITEDHLPSDLTQKSTQIQSDISFPTRKHLDQKVLINALQQTGGNKAKAAKLLGVSRRTIYRKLKQFNILY